MLSEFELIKRYFTHPAPHAVLGVGDDAALVKVAKGMELVVSTDMLVSGTHFFPDADPYKLGRKALAVNFSDMAAMGATPRWATLSLAMPEADEKWLKPFAKGFMDLARAQRVDLIGGDTARGPLNICVQIMGEVPAGKALRRDGAKQGDEIWISGQIGDAALGLAHLQNRIHLEAQEAQACLNKLHTPDARVTLGMHLLGLANSAIDISDGILADLGHILERSGVAAVIEFKALPKSAVLQKYLGQDAALQALLAGGDDYELCFTAPKKNSVELAKLSRKLRLPLTRIGNIKKGRSLILLDATGKRMALNTRGYDHFG
ncbi:MAG: thiamine-phosphate kinase [Burkholderiales bacterium]